MELHPILVERWDSWIENVISKDENEAIEKNYSVKGKCHLEAPILNREVRKAVLPYIRTRDSK